MKPRIALFILLIMTMPIIQAVAADEQDSIVTDSVRFERLAGLCELWGVVKYFHPYLAYKDIDWDEALIKTIPRVNKAVTSEDYKLAIEYLLAFLKDPNTYVVDDSYVTPRSKISDLPDDGDYPPVIRTEDSIAIIIANDSERFHKAMRSFEGYPLSLRHISRTSTGVIIDARCLNGPDLNNLDNRARYDLLEFDFPWLVSGLLQETYELPAIRRRTHYPFLEPQTPWSWSGFVYYNKEAYNPRVKDDTDPVPVVFIINEGSADLLPILSILQDKKMGAIVFEGPFDREGGIETYPVRLADDVIVDVRLTELVKSDGTESVHPDLVIPFTTDTTLLDCPPMKTAINIIKGHRVVPPVVGNILSPVVPRIHDKYLAEMLAPKLEYRLLALFRYWNVIKYFSPYHAEFGDSWDSDLIELIPIYEAADGEDTYEKAVAKSSGKLGSFDATFFADIANPIHECFPSFNVDFIEDKTVVTYIGTGDSLSQISRLNIGDIVLELDGEDIAEKRSQLADYFSSPTRQGVQQHINTNLLGSRHPSPVRIKVLKENGQIEQYEIPRHYGLPPSSNRNSYPIQFQKIGDDIRYMWLFAGRDISFKDSLEVIMQSKALIIDLRCDLYHLSQVGRRLASILAKDEVTAYLKRGIERQSPDLDSYAWSYLKELISPDEEYQYRGKVVVLIDASINGETERLCLCLDAATDVTIVGLPTYGDPGESESIHLPGDHVIGPVKYPRIDVRYPDDRPVFGIGIQPDILIEPTIDGIREGRDEILDAAIEFLEKELKK